MKTDRLRELERQSPPDVMWLLNSDNPEFYRKHIGSRTRFHIAQAEYFRQRLKADFRARDELIERLELERIDFKEKPRKMLGIFSNKEEGVSVFELKMQLVFNGVVVREVVEGVDNGDVGLFLEGIAIDDVFGSFPWEGVFCTPKIVKASK